MTTITAPRPVWAPDVETYGDDQSTQTTTRTPAGLDVAAWQDADGYRIDSATAYGRPGLSASLTLTGGTASTPRVAVRLHRVEDLTVARIHHTADGHPCRLILRSMAGDELVLNTSDPAALASLLRHAADLLTA